MLGATLHENWRLVVDCEQLLETLSMVSELHYSYLHLL